MVLGSALQALNQRKQALAAFDKVIELEPSSYRAWTYRGLLLNALHREDEANTSFFKALEINPNYSLAQAWLHLYLTTEAMKAKASGQSLKPDLQEHLEQALSLQSRAIQIESSSFNWSCHTNILELIGRTEEALNSNQRAIQIDSNNYSAWSERGCLLEKLQRDEEALSCFDRALKIKPENEFACHHRSVLLEKLGLHEEAVAAYKQTAQLFEASIPERVNLVGSQYKEFAEASAYCELGSILKKAHRYEEAIAAYRRSRRIKPKENPIWCYSWICEANLLEKLEQQENLFALYDEWLEAAETVQEKYYVWIAQGDMLKRLKQYEKSIAAYDHCIDLDPSLAGGWIGRGDVFYELQRLLEALECYNKAIAIDSTNENALTKRELVFKQFG